jgi:putative ABC transport system permease protein
MFAWHALKENLLRTLLSLLGVTVGVFSIIAVLTAVDGLDRGIKKSLAFLGDRVIYVEKWPWLFSDSYPWWKYFRRPQPSTSEFEYLREHLTWASAVSIFDMKGGLTVKHKNNTASSVTALGISHDHNLVASIPVAQGRYFSPAESSNGKYVVLVGHNIAQDLFQGGDAVGKEIKLMDIKFRVVGILEKQGDNLLGAPSNDLAVMIPYKALAKLFASGDRGISPTIAAKGLEEDEGMMELENEMRGLMRRYRGLKPKQEDSFALNRPEVFAELLGGIIGVLNVAGTVIGLFGILIGGFGIANIMFVSVKERTNLIGIQKSLGAKNYFILFQFLFEAVLLSLFGGMTGLSLVYALEFIPFGESFSLELSGKHLVLGVLISSVVGMVSGIVPALVASRMDPVEAIRTN